MRNTSRIVLAALAAVFASGQSERLKFEVVAVKPCRDAEAPPAGGRKGGGGGRITATPGRLTAECATLRALIRSAYIQFPNGERVAYVSPRVMLQEIKGSPGWIDSERFTIEAKTEGPVSTDIMRGPMLQSLLEERFGLKIRHEPREVSIYALRVSKGGPKFPPAKPGSCVVLDRDHPPPDPESGRPLPKLCGLFSGEYLYGTSMAVFCRHLTSLLDRDVVDKTELAGNFDIHLFGINDALADAPDGPPGQSNIAAALEAVIPRLGLKLEPAKGSGEFLVIDHVERPAVDR